MGQVIIQSPGGGMPATTVSSVSTANVVGTNVRYAREDHQHAGVVAAGVSNLGNTAGNTAVLPGQIVFVGSDNITLSQATDANNRITVSISAAAAAAGTFRAGISTAGNTAGTSGTVSGQIVIVASNGLNASQSVNGQSATLSLINSLAIGVSDTGNTAGNTQTVQKTVIIAGTNNVTVSQSTGANVDTVWISAGAEVDYWRPHWGTLGAAAIENASCYVMPLPIKQRLVVDRAIQSYSFSISTATNSSHAGVLSLAYGIYTLNGSTLSQHTSGSTNYQYTNTSNNSTSVLSGFRLVTCPLSATLTPGDYWIAMWHRSSTTNANWVTISQLMMSGINSALSGQWLSASNTTVAMMLGSGRISATTSTLPSAITLSNLACGSTQWRNMPSIYLQNGTV